MKGRLILEYLVSSLSSDMRTSCLKLPNFATERRPEEIWKQKVFCVLSSQYSARKAAAIADSIVESVPFFGYHLSMTRIEEACYNFLSSATVGYRFPKSRSRQISLCWFPFSQIKDEYHEFISSCGTEESARLKIIETFPGIGFKQASMFLRNIGASRTLSVVDVHTLFYLNMCHGFEVSQLTPKRYLQAEDILRKAAAEHDLELNVFDVVVWAAVKAVKRANPNV